VHTIVLPFLPLDGFVVLEKSRARPFFASDDIWKLSEQLTGFSSRITSAGVSSCYNSSRIRFQEE
jgi:hypothetical protein